MQSYRQAAVQGYINNDVFFSQEGVFMHQMMDCIFMGPYTKVNYWPGDSQGRLSVPAWYRDLNGLSMLLAGQEQLAPSYPQYGEHARQYQSVHADQVLQSLTGQLQTFYSRALEDPSVWMHWHYLD